MTWNDSSTPLPNLADPSSPDVRYRLQVGQYVVVACLTLCVWDWLLAISDEFEMIRRSHRLVSHILHGMYVIIRIFPILYLAINVVLNEERNVNACRMFARLISATNLVIMPAVSLLFFARLSAVYSRNRYVMAFFGACWLVILGIFIFDTTTVLLRFSDGYRSMHCFFKPHDAWGYIATAIYDTLIYLAMSWQLASFDISNYWTARVRSSITGGGLHGLSKVLLHSGQVYYFVTIGFTICTVVFISSTAVPPEWRTLLFDPNMTITSIMACKLFRELKLGLFADPVTEVVFSTIVYKDMYNTSPQLCKHAYQPRRLDDSADMPDIWDIENPATKDMVLKVDRQFRGRT